MLKLLQLCPVTIATPRSGVQLRNYHMAKQLSRTMQVTHLGFYNLDEDVVDTKELGSIRLNHVPRPRSYTLATLIRGFVGPVPAPLLNYISEPMKASLLQLLREQIFDIVQLEGVEMSPYIPLVRSFTRPSTYITLDWHNIESEALERHAQFAATALHRTYLKRAAAQMRRVESTVLRECDLHITMSERDTAALRRVNSNAHFTTGENGVDTEYFTVKTALSDSIDRWKERNRVLFVGAMDYTANVVSILDFADRIWPRILSTHPALRLTIVGRNPVEKIRALGERPGIEVTGTVSDVRPFYAEALVTVVPLLIGGGTRLKIPEAWAAGVPVVTTTLGAEGLRIQPEVDCLIADDTAAFLSHVSRLREDYELWRTVAANGRSLSLSYDWSTTCGYLAQHYLDLLTATRCERATIGEKGDKVAAAL